MFCTRVYLRALMTQKKSCAVGMRNAILRNHLLKLYSVILFIRWLVPRAGKMIQIARFDWLPERARWSPLGTTRCIPQANFPQKPYNKSFIDQVCSVKMAGYWPRSFFFFASL